MFSFAKLISSAVSTTQTSWVLGSGKSYSPVAKAGAVQQNIVNTSNKTGTIKDCNLKANGFRDMRYGFILIFCNNNLLVNTY